MLEKEASGKPPHPRSSGYSAIFKQETESSHTRRVSVSDRGTGCHSSSFTTEEKMLKSRWLLTSMCRAPRRIPAEKSPDSFTIYISAWSCSFTDLCCSLREKAMLATTVCCLLPHSGHTILHAATMLQVVISGLMAPGRREARCAERNAGNSSAQQRQRGRVEPCRSQHNNSCYEEKPAGSRAWHVLSTAQLRLAVV